MCLIYKQINVQVEESGSGKSCDQRVLESRHRPGSLTLTLCGWGPPDSWGSSPGLPSGDCRASLTPHLRVKTAGRIAVWGKPETKRIKVLRASVKKFLGLPWWSGG